MISGSTSRGTYIPAIDGLRALAVLSVVLFHFDRNLLPGGFSGVDIFFVISGYVIAQSLTAGVVPPLGEYLLAFYKRRVLRIVPALLVMLVLVSFVTTLFVPRLPDIWLSGANESTALWAFFGLSNIRLVHNGDGYFAFRVPFNPFVHTWSLAVEEQFYFFFPFILYLWLAWRGRTGVLAILSGVVLPAAALVSLAYAAHQTAADHERAFYLLPSRFWELAAGALLYQLQTRWGHAHLTGWRSQCALAMGGALLVWGFSAGHTAGFPFPWALLPVGGTVLVIAGVTASAPPARGIHDLLQWSPLRYVGRISYSLYLWHWPVFVLFRWTIGMDATWSLALAPMLSFGCAVLSYHFVENPTRRSAVLCNLSSGRLVASAFCTIAIACAGVGLSYREAATLGLRLSSVDADTNNWSAQYEGQLPPPFAGADPRIGVGHTIFLVGDSHAVAYNSMVSMAATLLGARVEMFARGGCPLADLNESTRDSANCREFFNSTQDALQTRSKPGDIVFLASLRLRRLSEEWIRNDESELRSPTSDAVRSKERELALHQAIGLVDALQSRKLNVVISAPLPLFRSPPYRCVDWFNRHNPICAGGFTVGRQELLDYREPIMNSLRVLHDGHGVDVWDPFPVLCPGPVCSAFDGAYPFFRDGDHLSGYGNRVLVTSFAAEIMNIWNLTEAQGRMAQSPIVDPATR